MGLLKVFGDGPEVHEDYVKSQKHRRHAPTLSPRGRAAGVRARQPLQRRQRVGSRAVRARAQAARHRAVYAPDRRECLATSYNFV